MPSRPIFQPPRRPPRPATPGRRRPQSHRARGTHASLRADITGAGLIVVGDRTGANTATVTFEHHQVAANVRVLWDFDNDGDFDDPLEDITSYVLAAETFLGRDFPSNLTGKSGPGRFDAVLNNDDARFSFFNTASPLNTAPRSLANGRKLRVQTIEATNPDPVLLARDRFVRPDGALNQTENGLVWTHVTADTFIIQNEEAFATNSATAEHTALVDVGVNDHYTQVTHGQLETTTCGIFYRYQDANNYGIVTRGSDGSIAHASVVGGIDTEIIFGEQWTSGGIYSSGGTFGVLVQGAVATIYFEGVALGTATAAPFASTRVGMNVRWAGQFAWRPSIRRFDVWDGLPEEVQGILWTGEVTEITPNTDRGHFRTATLRAEGVLADAASADITPEPSTDGVTTGIAVGHMLAKAQLLHPPGPIQPGDITTGPFGFDRQKALGLARQFEETEIGFLFETPEGTIGYDSRTARDSRLSTVTFSDSPGTQYTYEDISPRDWRREIRNRVQAGVAPSTPPFPIREEEASGNTAGGVANDVSFALPTGLDDGTLILVIITATVGFTSTVQWLEPIWWVAMRTSGAGGRQRVYAHICDGSESGDTITFYDDTTATGGAWDAQMLIIPKYEWYGSHEGIAMAEHVPGPNPAALQVPWGLEPSLFIATHAGMVSIDGGSLPSGSPNGYGAGVGAFLNGIGSNVYDMFQQVVWKVDIKAVEDPTTFGSEAVSQFVTTESTVIAIRGFNGDPIPETGVTTIRRDDTASQDARNGAVLSWVGPDLFRHPAAAATYCDRLLGRYSTDRPLFRITFTATKSAAYRNQATLRRIGDRITLVADNEAGMGVDGDFHIESITNRFREGVTLWEVDWELSPAENMVRADTSGSELSGALTAQDPGTVESFNVTVTQGEIWILSAEQPNMFPFRTVCENEIWLVTAITGQTTTQTWTVQRAHNGFPQAHSAGTAVHLLDQWKPT